MKQIPMLQLVDITKSFGGLSLLRGVSLDIAPGEFVTILGASGSGKTTLLRIIAGLEPADTGDLFLDGVRINDTPPHLRNVNTIFQSYALFPHMNVEENIGYSLKLKKVPEGQIHARVQEMLTLVQLEGYGKRRPNSLSGGQKQRVAIARALLSEPKVLLLDEPLGALDLNLRRQMQGELKRLQKQLGTAFLYITHDQEEAINLSDRIALLHEGKWAQVGAVKEFYQAPANDYVRNFLGEVTFLEKDGKTYAVRKEHLLEFGEEGALL